MHAILVNFQISELLGIYRTNNGRRGNQQRKLAGLQASDQRKNSAKKKKKNDEASFCTVVSQMLISQVLPNSKKILLFAHAVVAQVTFGHST